MLNSPRKRRFEDLESFGVPLDDAPDDLFKCQVRIIFTRFRDDSRWTS